MALPPPLYFLHAPRSSSPVLGDTRDAIIPRDIWQNSPGIFRRLHRRSLQHIL